MTYTPAGAALARKPNQRFDPSHIRCAAGKRTRRKENVITITGPRDVRQGGRKTLQIQSEMAKLPRPSAFTILGTKQSLKRIHVRQQAEGAAPTARAARRKRAPVVHEEVYAKLRRAIIDGQLEPGRALSVRTLAAQFSVSAMPARESIRRLVALGALEMTPTRRIMVARMTPSKVEELTEARIPLETRLAVRAMQRTGGKAKSRQSLVSRLSKIDERLDAAIERGDVAAYSKANSDFHFTLYAAADAPVLLGVVESLWLQIGPFMRVVIQRLGASTMVDQHKQAIDALVAGDVKKLEKSIRLDILEGMTRIGDAVARA